MPEVVSEFASTFLLAFVLVLVAFDTPEALPWVLGATYTTLVYLGRAPSGGHANPAVTLGVFLAGRMLPGDAGRVLAAQFGGAATAAIVAHQIHPVVLPHTDQIDPAAVLVIDIVLTSALVWTHLAGASSPSDHVRGWQGLGAGAIVAVAAMVGATHGAGMINPALVVTTSMLELSPWNAIGLLLGGQVIGAVLGWVLHRASAGTPAPGA